MKFWFKNKNNYREIFYAPLMEALISSQVPTIIPLNSKWFSHEDLDYERYELCLLFTGFSKQQVPRNLYHLV